MYIQELIMSRGRQTVVDWVEGTKPCTGCKETLDLSLFYKNNKTFTSLCKACYRKRNAAKKIAKEEMAG